MEWIVICRADRKPDGSPGDYELSTRTVFGLPSEAEVYKAGVSASREPIVVRGDWRNLRTEKRTDAFGRRLHAYQVSCAIFDLSKKDASDEERDVWNGDIEVLAISVPTARMRAHDLIHKRPEYKGPEVHGTLTKGVRNR